MKMRKTVDLLQALEEMPSEYAVILENHVEEAYQRGKRDGWINRPTIRERVIGLLKRYHYVIVFVGFLIAIVLAVVGIALLVDAIVVTAPLVTDGLHGLVMFGGIVVGLVFGASIEFMWFMCFIAYINWLDGQWGYGVDD